MLWTPLSTTKIASTVREVEGCKTDTPAVLAIRTRDIANIAADQDGIGMKIVIALIAKVIKVDQIGEAHESFLLNS